MEAINGRELRAASRQAMPTARLGMITAATRSNDSQVEDWLNPFQVAIEAAALPINPATAGLVLDLLRRGKLPSWAASVAPIRLLRYIAAQQ